jgi:hypothetical protein
MTECDSGDTGSAELTINLKRCVRSSDVHMRSTIEHARTVFNRAPRARIIASLSCDDVPAQMMIGYIARRWRLHW